MKFLDEAKVWVESGSGGDGCLSFRREKYVEFGGPDGGDGGRGGDVIVACVPSLNTLIDFRYRQHFKAGRGGPGMGDNRNGKRGRGAVLTVPAENEVLDEFKEQRLADLTEPGQRAVIARGGRGGRGNARFNSSTNQAPRRADPGEPGQGLWLWLRLKLIADAGLIGLPNAGKSTFLAAVSRARPKIADYPFTTLHPNLGVVSVGDATFVLADIPCLIEGAHAGAGLGTRFLGHLERSGVLLHLVDGTQDDPAAAYRTVGGEVEAYGHGLAGRPEIVALNKADALTDDVAAARRAELAGAVGAPVALISGVSGAGVDAVLRDLAAHIARQREARDPAPAPSLP